MSTTSEKLINYSLGILLAFLALNAFGGGYYGMSGAKDVPLEWLEGGPFKNYFIPSLFFVYYYWRCCFACIYPRFQKTSESTLRLNGNCNYCIAVACDTGHHNWLHFMDATCYNHFSFIDFDNGRTSSKRESCCSTKQ